MSHFVAETKHLTIPMQKLKTIHISLKNYKLNICAGEGSELELRFHNTSVQSSHVREVGCAPGLDAYLGQHRQHRSPGGHQLPRHEVLDYAGAEIDSPIRRSHRTSYID